MQLDLFASASPFVRKVRVLLILETGQEDAMSNSCPWKHGAHRPWPRKPAQPTPRARFPALVSARTARRSMTAASSPAFSTPAAGAGLYPDARIWETF